MKVLNNENMKRRLIIFGFILAILSFVSSLLKFLVLGIRPSDWDIAVVFAFITVDAIYHLSEFLKRQRSVQELYDLSLVETSNVTKWTSGFVAGFLCNDPDHLVSKK
jgi:hypothetical protein